MAERWHIHTVVFDLDDTLYPERDYVYSGFAAVDGHLQRVYGVQGFLSAARRLFDNGLRGRVFDEVLPGLGVAATAEKIADLVQVYREHEPKLELYPDAAAALAWLQPRVRLGLITDGYAVTQLRKIQALGLEAVIPHRIVTDLLGRDAWKPSPIAFRQLMELCPGEASGFLYIGDNPKKDFIPPRALGWRTVRVHRAEGEHAMSNSSPTTSPEAAVGDLRALLPLLVRAD